jgi:uncharacterized membrane protein
MRNNSVILNLFSICLFITIEVAIVFFQLNSIIVRLIFALPFVFLLPGYVFMEMLFPKRELGSVEQFSLTLGFSLALVILGGFVLNCTSWGLTAESWVVLLGCTALSAFVFARLRRRGKLRIITKPIFVRLSVKQVVMFGLALIVAVTAYEYSLVGARQQPTTGFTQLWVLSTNKADDIDILIGVKNEELSAMEYRLHINMEDCVLDDWISFELKPGQRWDTAITLPSDCKAGPLDVKLYNQDIPETPYRWVVLQRNGSG